MGVALRLRRNDDFGHGPRHQLHFFHIAGDAHGKVEFFLDQPGERLLGLFFAVNQHDLHAGMGHFPDPVQNLALPGMR